MTFHVPPQSVRWRRLWLACMLLGLALSGAAAAVLPVSAGWENGLLEDIQVVVLLAGAGMAVLAARRQVAGDSEGLVAKGFAMAAAPVWCLLTARELSWGAALLPPIDFSAEGPVYSSAHLWYKPAVVPLALIVLAWCAWVLLRSRILRAVPALLRSPQFVWAELAILLLAAALSTYAEGHLGIPVASFLQGRAVVVEEWAELFAYFALVVAQWQILVLLRHAGDRLASQ
ncbi:hypothetical protein QRO11_10950 [Paracidovorax citrulli]|uniref:Transmembrane protein n=1 Tax=Paracidovorax citrulli TaxID=80869 RepID=A0ABY9AWQ9_PARCI|nr:hypothetical protein [Paracidovorax citrulli]UEG48221.1 hypothetical protein LKW27_10350 [Paracidovorax citrulli]WIY31384.1 hypothetical protein QRO09_06620 [Paracidovorax citrulli]WIY36804.1 hypothetical protein QRO11_10950 [Paracidovorax citrulli]WIY40662.1 hypothetical protein QRO10_06900 [Paracidovorax citrulli]WIY42103.1 hypothetical protein QRO12_14135 [Paracidovorax citrulli]